MEAIDVLGVAKVRSADGLGQRILGLRAHDNVGVVVHETIAGDVEALLAGLVGEQRQICPQHIS